MLELGGQIVAVLKRAQNHADAVPNALLDFRQLALGLLISLVARSQLDLGAFEGPFELDALAVEISQVDIIGEFGNRHHVGARGLQFADALEFLAQTVHLDLGPVELGVVVLQPFLDDPALLLGAQRRQLQCFEARLLGLGDILLEVPHLDFNRIERPFHVVGGPSEVVVAVGFGHLVDPMRDLIGIHPAHADLDQAGLAPRDCHDPMAEGVDRVVPLEILESRIGM